MKKILLVLFTTACSSHLKTTPLNEELAQAETIGNLFNARALTMRSLSRLYINMDDPKNDDPELEESQAQKIGYITDQHSQMHKCQGCKEAKAAGVVAATSGVAAAADTSNNQKSFGSDQTETERKVTTAALQKVGATEEKVESRVDMLVVIMMMSTNWYAADTSLPLPSASATATGFPAFRSELKRYAGLPSVPLHAPVLWHQ